MKDMGLQSYRYSISWSRVMPDGTGAINEQGLQVRAPLRHCHYCERRMRLPPCACLSV